MAKKIKGKEWYTLIAPKMFKNKQIGEALITDPKEAIKRSIIINYTKIDGHPSKYYIKIKLKADKVEDKKIKMKYIGHECQRDYIAQMVRKRTMRIDNRIPLETKDGKKLIIKTIGISLRRTKTSIKNEIRKKIQELAISHAKELKFDELIKSILSDKFQKSIRKEVNKLYPLTRFEVRKVETSN